MCERYKDWKDAARGDTPDEPSQVHKFDSCIKLIFVNFGKWLEVRLERLHEIPELYKRLGDINTLELTAQTLRAPKDGHLGGRGHFTEVGQLSNRCWTSNGRMRDNSRMQLDQVSGKSGLILWYTLDKFDMIQGQFPNLVGQLAENSGITPVSRPLLFCEARPRSGLLWLFRLGPPVSGDGLSCRAATIYFIAWTEETIVDVTKEEDKRPEEAMGNHASDKSILL